jgi:hypothetical protein
MSTIEIKDALNANAIAQSPDWRTASTDLLKFWVGEMGRCFSSGEIAAAMRHHRPDLAFSVPTLGSYMRDMFYTGAMPMYTDDGSGTGVPVPPVQISRFTVGRYPTRTPAGQEVFVYGPNQEACEEHDFEVFVPRWDALLGRMETMDDAPAPATTADGSVGGPVHAAAKAAYSAAPVKTTDRRATVWSDGRLCVGRAAIEALCHLSGDALRAGDPVYVKVEPGTKAVVTMTDPGNGAKAYTLVKDKGNVAFYSGDATKPFIAHDVYHVTVSATEITVDLTVRF